MTARAISEIALGLLPSKTVRSFQPVQRDSMSVGQCERHLWQPLGRTNRDARRVIAARLAAARRYDRQHKQKGCRNGALGHVALEVLRELYDMVDFRTGRVDPAISTLCNRIRRSRAAVVAAMARLREHGFLSWVRRFEPTGNSGAGPQIRQATNAYGLSVPKIAAEWVRKIIDPAPLPDCEAARHEADRVQVETWLASSSTREVVDYAVGVDAELAAVLRRIGAHLEGNGASSPGGQKPYSSNL